MKLHNPYVKSIDKLDVTYIGMDMSAMNCRTCTVRGCNNYNKNVKDNRGFNWLCYGWRCDYT